MTDRARPFLVVEGPAAAVAVPLAEAVAEARSDGWAIVDGWAAPLTRERVACTGTILGTDDARRALLAAISGAGLIVASRADRETIDRFLDDLRRLGPVDHVVAAARPRNRLSPRQRAVLGLLGEGLTVDEAAVALGIDPAAARERLEAARAALGVASTAEAIVAALSARR